MGDKIYVQKCRSLTNTVVAENTFDLVEDLESVRLGGGRSALEAKMNLLREKFVGFIGSMSEDSASRCLKFGRGNGHRRRRRVGRKMTARR
ncbi:unnamed protein product [Microthlaspi erraticum]|uniref:Uncharacterized protein n=1 Tax=Microthlaspi erraticum TaxID=1685480 RepID=A0A6D2JGX6_9BRAS|nr:unnamed protein product [Microthlaspi erraticum]